MLAWIESLLSVCQSREVGFGAGYWYTIGLAEWRLLVSVFPIPASWDTLGSVGGGQAKAECKKIIYRVF